VLNNPEIVTEQSRLKVEAAIAELGFVQTSAAPRRTDTLAANHLLDQGARRLVYLAGFLQLHAISGRLQGIRRAVAEVGGSLDAVEAPNLKIGSGREPGREVLQSRRIDGMICPSDPLGSRCHPGGDRS
jgi:DNA-binding LacI/PurR family transcriptional regulator